jgi:hypothetical protein
LQRVLLRDGVVNPLQGARMPRDNQGERRATIRVRMAPG